MARHGDFGLLLPLAFPARAKAVAYQIGKCSKRRKMTSPVWKWDANQVGKRLLKDNCRAGIGRAQAERVVEGKNAG